MKKINYLITISLMHPFLFKSYKKFKRYGYIYFSPGFFYAILLLKGFRAKNPQGTDLLIPFIIMVTMYMYGFLIMGTTEKTYYEFHLKAVGD